jgi:hypothetical protein
MQIINLMDHESWDIEPPMRQMAESDDPLEAFRGQKLLQLVQYLKAKGPAPTSCGNVRSRELWLKPRDLANDVLVKVWVDWFDYSALHDGLPESHYRFQIRRGKRDVTQDARAYSLAEAEKVIWDAFGWQL